MSEPREDWENLDSILHQTRFLYVFELISTKLIGNYQENSVADQFRIEKTEKLIV